MQASTGVFAQGARCVQSCWAPQKPQVRFRPLTIKAFNRGNCDLGRVYRGWAEEPLLRLSSLLLVAGI